MLLSLGTASRAWRWVRGWAALCRRHGGLLLDEMRPAFGKTSTALHFLPPRNGWDKIAQSKGSRSGGAVAGARPALDN